MGTKYIVEIEENENLYKTKITSDGKSYMTAAYREPYTEPNLEQVRKEAYEEGHRDGMQLSINDAKLREEYKRGLFDAWEVARKIQDAGRDLRWWLHNYTAQEAIDRLTYEVEKDSIKIWDEVKAFEKKPFIVTGFGYGDDEEDVYCHGFVTENGISTSAKKSSCVKTGRHFHDIDEIFKEMGGRAGWPAAAGSARGELNKLAAAACGS